MDTEYGCGRFDDIRASERQGDGTKALSAKGTLTAGHLLIVGAGGAAEDGGDPIGNPDADGKVLASTAAGVRYWVSQVGGAALLYGTYMAEGAGSSSAYATKGNVITITRSVTLYYVWVPLGAAGTFYVTVAELNTSTNAITSVLGTSASITLAESGTGLFVLSVPVSLSPSRIAILVTKTDGTSTAVCPVEFPGSHVNAGSGTPWFVYYGSARYASVAPGVGDSVLYDQTAAVSMQFTYSYSV